MFGVSCLPYPLIWLDTNHPPEIKAAMHRFAVLSLHIPRTKWRFPAQQYPLALDRATISISTNAPAGLMSPV